MKNFLNNTVKIILYIFTSILSIVLIGYLFILVSINIGMEKLSEKHGVFYESTYNSLRTILRALNHIVDFIPFLILKKGYKIHENASVYKMITSNDQETVLLSNQILAKNNLVLYFLYHIVQNEQGEGFNFARTIRNFNKEIDNEPSMYLEVLVEERLYYLNCDRYFLMSATVFFIIITNLTIINTNFKWIH